MSARTRSARRARRVAALALTSVLAVAASACGVEQGADVMAATGASGATGSGATGSTLLLDEGSFEGTGGAVFLRQAAAATAEVTTQRVAMRMTTTGIPIVGDVEMTYEGAFDNESGRGRMTVDMGDLLAGLGGGSGRMDMVLDGDVVYLRSDLFSSMAGGKPWVRITDDSIGGGPLDTSLGFQGDPTAFLDFLEGVGDELETVGRDDLRGVPTTHLRTDIDMAKLLEQASAEDRAAYEESLQDLGAMSDVFGPVPVEAWVDDQGYVRRFLLTFTVDGGTTMGSAITVTIDMELYDFNEPVDVVIPDPSQVSDLSSLGGFGN